VHTVDVSGKASQFAVIKPQIHLAGGIVARNVTLGALSLGFEAHTLAEVGNVRVVCLRAATLNGTCPSSPFCLQANFSVSCPTAHKGIERS
jgi:hypothetical protein